MMAIKTAPVDRAAAIRACLDGSYLSLLDYFLEVEFSEGVMKASTEEEAYQALTEEDLEAIREAPFDNRIDYNSHGHFGLFLGMLPNLVEQLYPKPKPEYWFTLETYASHGSFEISFWVRNRIGRHDYEIKLFTYYGTAWLVACWDEFMDVALMLAEWAVEMLGQWEQDRLYVVNPEPSQSH